MKRYQLQHHLDTFSHTTIFVNHSLVLNNELAESKRQQEQQLQRITDLEERLQQKEQDLEYKKQRISELEKQLGIADGNQSARVNATKGASTSTGNDQKKRPSFKLRFFNKKDK